MAYPKNKVLLVNYAGYLLGANTFIPDNSLGSLAAMLLRHGVPIEILDLQSPAVIGSVMDHAPGEAAREVLNALDRGEAPSPPLVARYHEDRRQGEQWLLDSTIRVILRKIPEEDVGLVGFKLWAGEGIRGAIRIAEAIRAEYPHVMLVAGGPAVQYCGETLREVTDVFDYLVPGDGEHAILLLATQSMTTSGRATARRGLSTEAFARQLRDALAHHGVQMRRQAGPGGWPRVAQLDDLPFPATDAGVYPGSEGFYKFRILDETRGCFNSCAFCAHTSFNGHGIRRRTAAAVVDEMARLQRTEGVDYFRFSGSNPPWKLVVSIAEEILSRGLKLSYSAYSSVNNARPEHFGMMRASGMRSLFVGIESGDPTLLRRAHNKDNGGRDHVLHLCRTGMENDLFMALSFIMPAPFETEATKRATLDLIGDIFSGRSYGSVLLLPPQLTPKTLWWERMSDYGFEFTPGVDRRSYVTSGVQQGSDYLLPFDTWADFGFRLHGKSMQQLLAECSEFSAQVERMGVLTKVDDAGFMLALMGGLDPYTYKRKVVRGLILGGKERLSRLVGTLNQAARSKACSAVHPCSTAA